MATGTGSDPPGVEAPLPPRWRKLWRLTTPSRMGRPARMTLDQIVSTALAIADQDGLAGVTLPKVARSLGATDMALYRHVESKDELLVLLRDAGLGDPPTVSETGSWRAGLRTWAHGQWTAYRRRPWLAQIPISEPPIGPHEIAWMDDALGALTATSLGWAEKLRVVGLIGGYVRSTILLHQELSAGMASSGGADIELDYGRALLTLVDSDRFPHMAQLAASGMFAAPNSADADGTDASSASTDSAGDDHEFTPGLEMILDGVATMIQRAST